MSDTNTEQSLHGRAGAYRSWARTEDRSARTAPARAEFDLRFEREVDPEGVLPAAERARRAGYARKAYFLGLAAKSASARARKRRGRGEERMLAAELRAAADELSGGSK